MVILANNNLSNQNAVKRDSNSWKIFLPIIGIIASFALVICVLSEDFRYGATWEEDAMFYIVGKNFADFGFWKTKMLDDYAVGKDLAAHPMLYTHFPTISGVLQGIMQKCGVLSIKSTRYIFILFFLWGMGYYFLVFKKIFTERIAFIALAITGVNYLGVINWADNTVHSLHWVFLFGGIYHYLRVPDPEDLQKTSPCHLIGAWLFLFLGGFVTLIHALFLFITISAFFLLRIHRVKVKYLIFLFSAFPSFLVLHHLRVISLLGYQVWLFDQLANIKKASNIIDYQLLIEFYNKNGIVLWPSDFNSLTFLEVAKIFYDGLLVKEGLTGILILILTTIWAATFLLWKKPKVDLPIRSARIFLTLFLASVAWTFIFPTHAANYFNATPYIMLAGMINLSWAMAIAVLAGRPIFARFSNSRRGYALLIVVFFSIFSYQKADAVLKNPIVTVPGTEILKKYEGAPFYSNIWPLFVSYYTGEWTVGGMDARDAVRRDANSARWFLQKDKFDAIKYSKPKYYFYVSSSKFGPFAEPRHKKILDENFRVVEHGENWYIYDMN
jgi:hypothetical protein